MLVYDTVVRKLIAGLVAFLCCVLFCTGTSQYGRRKYSNVVKKLDRTDILSLVMDQYFEFFTLMCHIVESVLLL